MLVTGAGGGIGRATALRFGSEGAKLALVDKDEEGLLFVENECAALGYPVAIWKADVSEAEQIDRTIAGVVSDYGRIDIAINNAGIAWEEPFLDIKDVHWRTIQEVNLNGLFYVAQRTARQMVAQGGGVILNMASTNGLAGEANYAHYNASKGGVVLLTKTMAIELGKHGIRVNAVCPGYIQTPMSESIDSPAFVADYIRTKIPLGRVGKPQDVAGLFAFLASDDAAFITGESIVVDGGQLAN
ncbi:MAG: SDR family oxidoreductase [Paenibacillaceae bacterium]|nr:SDR family oxidoreductase [Paenibacillaceae bacterium]